MATDPFGVEPLVRRWAQTYDLVVRLLPDVALLPDGVRSTNDAFRDEIEAILDRIVPTYLSSDRCVRLPASQVTEAYDWMALAERLARVVGQPLRDPVPRPSRADRWTTASEPSDGQPSWASSSWPACRSGMSGRGPTRMPSPKRSAGPCPRTARIRWRSSRRWRGGLDPGLVATAGPRYFGFVIGGALPAAMAADWLTAAWDQNANLHALSPAAAAIEQVAGPWMLDLLGLPPAASFGFPTGAGLGNAVGLAAGRHAVLAREGWDVEARGLYGAPEITVVIGDEAHATLLTALQYLGLGRDRVVRVATDEQGRMRADAFGETVAQVRGPLLVAAQAGNVNTGGFDPMPEIADAVAGHPNAWVHVDGAFGLWAAVVTCAAPPGGGRRAGRLVVHGCPQVAQRRATTAASWRSATLTLIAPRCPPSRRTSCRPRRSANRGSTCSTARGGRARSPSTPRSGRSAGRACASWSSGAAGSPGAWPTASRRRPGSRS